MALAPFTLEETQFIFNCQHAFEQSKALPAEVLKVLHKHGLFKLFVPSNLGGGQKPLPEALEIIEDCSLLDGNVGWLVNIGSGGGYFAGYYGKQAAQQLFFPQNAVLAGSGYPGKAHKVDGGYTVTGSWNYCSGAGYAAFFTASALADGKMLAFTFMPDQVEIIPTWNAFGLKATESHSIRVNDAFVPDELVFDLSKPPVSFSEYKAYSFPFLQFAQLSFAAVVLGLYRAFMTECAYCQRTYNSNAERSNYVEGLLNDEFITLERTKTEFHAAAETAWNAHVSGSLTTSQLQAVTDTCLTLSSAASGVASRILSYMGMAAVMEDSRLNYIFRNLVTANQHVLLKPFPF